MKKNVIITVLATFCLTATLFMVSSSVGYDPWADLNDDGKIDMKDIGYEAKLFGTMGDPTKNVTVTNWPASTDVTVWYNFYVDSPYMSGEYETGGLGHLHILTYTTGLVDTEIATLKVIGKLWNSDHTGSTGIVAYETSFRPGASNFRAITIPVPSETFYFYVTTDGTGDCQFYLSFYLTGA